MANPPQVPINDPTARYTYTAAEAIAGGADDAGAAARLRSVYGLVDNAEIANYVKAGRRAYTLGLAYVAADEAAIREARRNYPPGESGQYVLTVKVRLPDRPPQTAGGEPEEVWKTVRVVVGPGAGVGGAAAAVASQIQAYEGEYEGEVIATEVLSAVAV